MRKRQKVEKKQNKKIKRQREEEAKTHHAEKIELTCKECGKSRKIVLNGRNRVLYTEERKKNHICMFCSDKIRR